MRVCNILNLDKKNVIAITMPGFGTSGRTYNNSKTLIQSYGADFREISIKDACIQHFKDINHKDGVFDITYENTQARERTQILFDVANQEGGIVVGTGDLSELALGWATYNGDHMSNYGINCSIPKTLVTTLIRHIKDSEEGIIKKTLEDILATPISPELLPLDENGNIKQETEKNVGPYILNDFFLYHFLRYGAPMKKIYFLALNTFKDEFTKEEIKATLILFVKRFFTQQFKRNCVPDGIKVGSVAVSPRGDLRMSSDTYYKLYLDEVEKL
jgi:NAD+ synthase (glutamine-hydrolysing)